VGRTHTNASISDIAPISAVVSHRALSITACVDDEVWSVTGSGLEIVVQRQHVVHLVICWIPLCLKFARVCATSIILVLAHHAVVVSGASSGNPGAHHTDGLVVSDICAEAPEVGQTEVHRSEELDELAGIVFPAEPTAVGSIKIHSNIQVFEFINCISNTGLVGSCSG